MSQNLRANFVRQSSFNIGWKFTSAMVVTVLFSGVLMSRNISQFTCKSGQTKQS